MSVSSCDAPGTPFRFTATSRDNGVGTIGKVDPENMGIHVAILLLDVTEPDISMSVAFISGIPVFPTTIYLLPVYSDFNGDRR